MLILLGVGIFLAIYLYFFRNNFFSELAISFLPYIFVLCCIACIIECFYLIYFYTHKIPHKSLNIFFTIILIIISFVISWLYGKEYFSFYNQSDSDIRLVETNGIKVFYANILYTNADYLTLQKKIEEENPDIVVLVEFSDAHESEMKDFFAENYQYINRNSWSTMLAGDVVFSKIPLDASLDKREADGSWRYSHIRVLCEESEFLCEKNVDLYVIHTSAPVSIKNYEMRNQQLEKIRNGYDLQKKSESGNPTIIIGDFNLSPWSYFYKTFTKDREMKNALSFQKPNYTWSLLQQGIFRSHIDQLFISPKVNVSEVNIETLSGSDHRSFLFTFGSKIE